MYAACLRGRGPLALMEFVGLVPIIPTRSKRDDNEECPDPGFLTVCRHVVVPLPKSGVSRRSKRCGVDSLRRLPARVVEPWNDSVRRS
jgi:hypothetical protein